MPIAGGTRCSIGIFSYLNTMTFGINADFDGYPDIDVLSGGIRRGIEELLALAGGGVRGRHRRRRPEAGDDDGHDSPPRRRTKPAKRTPAKKAAAGSAGEPGPAARGAARSARGRAGSDEPTGARSASSPSPSPVRPARSAPGLIPLLQDDDRIARVIGIARRPFDPAERGWTKMEYRQGDVRDAGRRCGRPSTAPTSSCTWRS